jgi:hypothetical protein
MAIKIGDIFKTNNFGNLEIIEKFDNDLFLVRFFNTGSYGTFTGNAIRHGKVKDKFLPIIAGVGYVGTFTGKVTDPEVVTFYSTWNDMLHRCFDPYDGDYVYYGAIGVTVDPSWFDFGTFLNDVKYLPGYENKLEYPGKYQLDKDFLQMHLPKSQRIYSKNTCIWLSKIDNTILMNADNILSNPGYLNVIKVNDSYFVRVNNRLYSQFDDPIAAANAANNVYNMRKQNNKFMNLERINNVPYMPYEELVKHQLNLKPMIRVIDKNNVSSTTIRDECSGVE